MRKRAYRSIAVKDVNVAEVLSWLGAGHVSVGLDVSKREIHVVVWKARKDMQRPWRVPQPGGIPRLVEIVKELAVGRRLIVALESTGTYGDAVRQALGDAGVEVHRVPGTAVRDYAEIFDGVPSQHDGKDAGIVAELAGIGNSEPWPCEPLSAEESRLKGEVLWMDTQQEILQLAIMTAVWGRGGPAFYGFRRPASIRHHD